MFWRGALFFVLSASVGISHVYAKTIENIRVWPAPHETRIVIDLDTKPSFKYFTLTKPYRLVVDLKAKKLSATLPINITGSDIVKKIRTSSPPDNESYRLVMELEDSSTPDIFTLPPSGDFSHRLVIDLPHKEKNARPVKKIITKSSPKIHNLSGNADIIVAIDPGHGGNDPGAPGVKRNGKVKNYEKEVTLPLSLYLAKLINDTPGLKAILTRSGDYYVDLNRRSEIARDNKAHLLVSIHADGFYQPQPKGASVWILSNGRANNEMARNLEKHERQSALLGGAGLVLQNNRDKYLSQAVLDLIKKNTLKEGQLVAASILEELKQIPNIKLHKDKPEAASLAVLKSTDIPSVLVEAGFMSNPQEEKLLLTRAYQQKIARAVYGGILNYFEKSPPSGTLFASRNKGSRAQTTSISLKRIPKSIYSSEKLVKTYTVKSGDFLGKIALNHGVSVASLRKANNLRSDELAVGQKIKIYGTKSKTIRHRVKSGEYLGKIAINYGVSIDSLREENRLRSDELAIGQTLIIPKR